MSTLYRDYRPNNFAEVLGQQHIKITLQNEISTGHLAQSFLFCGPRAVGKTTMARVLAKSINCLNRKEGESEPCNKCANCKAIKAGTHLDVIEIDAASNTGVDNVRENIISFSRIAPNQAKYKVFIIDEVHMLSPSAFNALLKIIEEPPQYILFILCTTEIHKVPQTIISRCERFDFKRIGVSDIVSKLRLITTKENKEVDQEVLEAIARRSGGHLRDAESLLGQIFALTDKRIGLKEAELLMPHYNNNEVIDLLSYLALKDAASALTTVNNLADAGVNMKNFIAELIFMTRKLAIMKISPQLADNLGLNLGDSMELKILELLKKISAQELLDFIKTFLIAYDAKNQLILQLPLELAIIEICNDKTEIRSAKVENVTGGHNPAQSESPISPSKTNFSQKRDNLKQGAVTMSHIDMDCSSVLEKWPEFLIKIKKHNHSLSFVLQNCQPGEIKDGKLHLLFKYKFHQDRVNDAEIKKLIEATLDEVFACKITFISELNEDISIEEKTTLKETEETMEQTEKLEKAKKNNESLMTNLLNTFGGEVIG
ncbi:MAG: DNA polymerase III subunit gamma/tau [Patescibacteria group bacterium]|nr:DNA polymerase III subunit gamma/tau [Patescibacteria group bacterium]MDD4443766.1 DNA polymerase III subunit gamma/tau [Patescibacteria group bacterium]